MNIVIKNNAFLLHLIDDEIWTLYSILLEAVLGSPSSILSSTTRAAIGEIKVIANNLKKYAVNNQTSCQLMLTQKDMPLIVLVFKETINHLSLDPRLPNYDELETRIGVPREVVMQVLADLEKVVAEVHQTQTT